MSKLLPLFFMAAVLNVGSLVSMQMGCQQEGQARAVQHYTATDETTRLNQIISHVWHGSVPIPAREHSVEKFIGGFVRSARENGRSGAVAFLEEAAGRGFAVDSACYSESRNGTGVLILKYFMVCNHFSRNVREPAERLAKALGSIRSIISKNDVRSVSFDVGFVTQENGVCFSFARFIAFPLQVPLAASKDVSVDVDRR